MGWRDQNGVSVGLSTATSLARQYLIRFSARRHLPPNESQQARIECVVAVAHQHVPDPGDLEYLGLRYKLPQLRGTGIVDDIALAAANQQHRCFDAGGLLHFPVRRILATCSAGPKP